jgi:hypothetical protein
MLTKNRTLHASLIMLAVVMICCQEVRAEATPKYVVAVPARRKTVSLLHDLYRIAPISAIAFRGSPDSANPSLYKWDGSGWIQVTAEEFRSFSSDAIVLVGDDNVIPAALVELSSAGGEPYRAKTLDIASLIRDLSKVLELSPQEITWLAKRHGLAVSDSNAERRRYGRWGKPGATKTDTPDEDTLRFEVPEEPLLPPIEPSFPEKGKTQKPAAKEVEEAEPAAFEKGMSDDLPPASEPVTRSDVKAPVEPTLDDEFEPALLDDEPIIF